jgi:putative ABC transport system permease protein
MYQDLRYGMRMLVKNPGFTVVAVLLLALAIATNTVMFSFIDAVLLKPLAYKDPERLVMVWELSSKGGKTIPSPPTFLEWRKQNRAFSHLTASTSSGGSLNLTGRGRAERIRGSFVSASYFEMLGAQPVIGRAFRSEEEQPGNEHVAILANRFWRQKFEADPNIVGDTIFLNNESYVVIGVLPASKIFDKETTDIWLPLAFKPEQLNPNVRFFSVLGRLKQDVTIDQANADMKRIAEGIGQKDRAGNTSYSAVVEPLRDHIVGRSTKTILFLLMGSAFFILLIASTNVANLLLARGVARQHEVAIRMALGATRLRLMQQFLTESLLLTIISGGWGVVLANWLVDAFIVLMPRLTIPVEAEVSLDWRVLLFTLAVTCFTTILFGLIPAWQSTRLDVARPLQERIVSVPARLNHNRARSLLLVLEIALSFVLTIGAALMVRSFMRLIQVELGFETDNILTLRTNLDQTRYLQFSQIVAYQSELLNRIRTHPGVVSVAATNALPLGGTSIKSIIQITGQKSNESGTRESAAIRVVSSDYFATLGIHLLKGRFFSEQDTAHSPSVLVINHSLAKRIGVDSDPIGARVHFAGDNFAKLSFTIVGVIADTKHRSPNSQSESEVYIPIVQVPGKALSSLGRPLFFVVRTAVDPAVLTATVQALAASVDIDQPVYSIKTMEQVYSESIAQPRFLTVLFSLFGTLSLVLVTIGIYGVMAYSVTQRAREIGIRMALGAQSSDVLRLVMRQVLLPTSAGIIIGLVVALALSHYLSSLLYEVTPTDTATYIGVALILTSVALLASYFPARMATKVDPIVALRDA